MRARATSMAAITPSRSSAQDDLLAVVALLEEHRVSLGRVLERHPVRDDEARIDLAALDARQQRPQVALDVTLPRPDGERTVHDGPHGKLVDEPSVDADDRDDAAVAEAWMAWRRA